jgi:hypothetical protein
MPDFPAAHSMDTTWFAIDADGYVGIFNSSEGGAIPNDLTRIDNDRIDFRSELVEILCNNKAKKIHNIASVEIEDVIKDASLDFLKDKISTYKNLAKSKSVVCDWYSIKNLVLELSHQLAIEELTSQANIILRFLGERIVVYVDKCDREWLKQAIRSQTVLAGKEASLEFNLSWLGWYEYDCDTWMPIPYDRNYPIEQPIHFDNLPPEIIKRLSITELPNIRFAETESIQPIEHMPCRTWKGTTNWIDTSGVEHDRFPEYPNRDRVN